MGFLKMTQPNVYPWARQMVYRTSPPPRLNDNLSAMFERAMVEVELFTNSQCRIVFEFM